MTIWGYFLLGCALAAVALAIVGAAMAVMGALAVKRRLNAIKRSPVLELPAQAAPYTRQIIVSFAAMPAVIARARAAIAQIQKSSRSSGIPEAVRSARAAVAAIRLLASLR
ncbi:MAG: hypothetical protein M3R51_10105 [Candidatus Eremiobacteraeota bacterium]|nr:hypothetical protein [Candidatus Eremiobacteraeota bacterium]